MSTTLRPIELGVRVDSRRRRASRSSIGSTRRRGPAARPTRVPATRDRGTRRCAPRSGVSISSWNAGAHVERERLAQVHLEHERPARHLRPHLDALGARRGVGLHDLLVPREALDREQRGPRERAADAALDVVHVGVRDLLARQQRGDALVARRAAARAARSARRGRRCATAPAGRGRRCASVDDDVAKPGRARGHRLGDHLLHAADLVVGRLALVAARRPSRRGAPRCGRRSTRS